MFCTDDKHLDTIENEGHISYNIKKSIQLGMNPISAVKMATYNAAKTYGLNDIGVLEEGKDADIVILDSLESVEVHSVYKQGRIVNTEFFTKEAKPVNESMLHTVVLKNISKDKIQIKAEGNILPIWSRNAWEYSVLSESRRNNPVKTIRKIRAVKQIWNQK